MFVMFEEMEGPPKKNLYINLVMYIDQGFYTLKMWVPRSYHGDMILVLEEFFGKVVPVSIMLHAWNIDLHSPQDCDKCRLNGAAYTLGVEPSCSKGWVFSLETWGLEVPGCILKLRNHQHSLEKNSDGSLNHRDFMLKSPRTVAVDETPP